MHQRSYLLLSACTGCCAACPWQFWLQVCKHTADGAAGVPQCTHAALILARPWSNKTHNHTRNQSQLLLTKTNIKVKGTKISGQRPHLLLGACAGCCTAAWQLRLQVCKHPADGAARVCPICAWRVLPTLILVEGQSIRAAHNCKGAPLQQTRKLEVTNEVSKRCACCCSTSRRLGQQCTP